MASGVSHPLCTPEARKWIEPLHLVPTVTMMYYGWYGDPADRVRDIQHSSMWVILKRLNGAGRRRTDEPKSGAPRRSRPIRAGVIPAAEGPASHGEASLAPTAARPATKRRQCDDQAAARKGEEIEPRYGIVRGPTGSDSWKAIVGAR